MEITSYKLAGIDVHKKMLAVVVTDAAQEGELRFERKKFGASPSDLDKLEEWLAERDVKEVVMESTAQYWRPVWQQLEGQYELCLAQAHSNRARKGRKRDFADAERLVRRQVAGELILSFVPNPEQRLWRSMTRGKHQLTRDRVRLQSQLEALLEDGRIKLSSYVSDLLGVSSRRILQALANGETDTARLAELADRNLRASGEQLQNALRQASTRSARHRQLLKLFLERLELIERQMKELDQAIANALQQHQDAVQRLAEVPGLGINSAHQIIAEVGPKAATFPSPGQLASWVGTCPGAEESAEVSKSSHSPKGNSTLRRVLTQCANAAVKSKGTIFAKLYRRLVGAKGHNSAIWAVAHKLCRVIWAILHRGVQYIEFGDVVEARTLHTRFTRLLKQIRNLGYTVQVTPPQALPGPPPTPVNP